MGTHVSMNRFVALLALLTVLLPGSGISETTMDKPVVLVTGPASQLQPLSPRQLRQLYLGIPITQVHQKIQPLINATDNNLRELFLQRILFMSARNYERHIVSTIFKTGHQGPASHTSVDALVDALKDQPGCVTFMTMDTATNTPGIRILQPLW